MMDFVFALHSHLPWVLHHGRWPHGSDWLTEAAVDTYLPLVEALEGLEHADVAAPITLGVTPIGHHCSPHSNHLPQVTCQKTWLYVQ